MAGPAGFRFVVDEISGEIEDAKRRAFNMKPALDLMGAKMLLSIDQNFRAEGRRDGSPGAWEALSPVTIAMRTKGRRGSRGKPKPLIDTGNLRQSTIQEADRKRLLVGSVVDYANDHHQDGVWGAFIMKLLRREIPAHMREVWVSAKAEKKRKKIARAAARAEKAKARAAGVAPKSTQTRVDRKKTRDAERVAKRKGAGGAKRKRRKRPKRVPPRPGLVLARRPVKAHTIEKTIRVPSRPIYLIQPRDMAQWMRIQANWVMRGTLSGAA
jgi:phage gpG-like protein